MFWKRKKVAKAAPLLPEKTVYRSLSEGAARFAAIARSAHGQPLDNSKVCTDPDRCSTLISPDEIWARQFMTQGIGPLTERNSIAKMPPMSSSFAMQSFTLAKSGEVKTHAISQHPQQAAAPGKLDPIGVEIGRMKRQPRRSWLSRFFFG
ncbi:MAG: hypothetical protein HY243_18575 [Proteobacteria bacterium]|nr:hypothetical protein [Pseudomonadota bacterium]